MATELLTHSKRQAWQNCPRYFYHKNVEHLDIRFQKSGRRRGTLFGDTLFYLQVAWEAGYINSESIALDKDDPLEIYLWVKEYVENAVLGLIELGHPAEEMEVEQVKIIVMVCAYVEKYGIDQRREIEYVLPLIHPRTGEEHTRFKLGGKMDGCVIRGPKKVDIIEDKFVKSIQRAMIERLPLDAQSSEYVSAFNAKGWEARVMYRHTRFPGINPKPPKEYKTKDNYPGETLEEFEERLGEDVNERNDWYLDEQILYFPLDHMRDFHAGRWLIADQIAAALDSDLPYDEVFPMNPSRCWEYGGCEFIPICTKIDIDKDMYVIREDNPELSVAVDTYGAEEE